MRRCYRSSDEAPRDILLNGVIPCYFGFLSRKIIETETFFRKPKKTTAKAGELESPILSTNKTWAPTFFGTVSGTNGAVIGEPGFLARR
jgi:hypothetical protein